METLGPKSGERAITGTGADLRKLSMEDSKRQLMSMGMSEEEVARELALPFCRKALPVLLKTDCTIAPVLPMLASVRWDVRRHGTRGGCT